jgi:tetratricopeptide (TPR) repeat protein
MHARVLVYVVILTLAGMPVAAETSSAEQLQVNPPAVRRAEPPPPGATSEELEKRADTLRAEKAYLDALDYYRAALAKKPGNAIVFNKAGIDELLMQRYKEAAKDFERSIKGESSYSDPYNNLGVIYYLQKKYGKAIRQYEKAIQLKPDSASYYSNLGAAYFSKKEFEKAGAAYNQALRLDPEIFDRTSHNGVTAQMSSPQDRAHFNYVLARLYAKAGDTEHSLQYLRRAMEEGYKRIEDVYKDEEFAGLRKDPRFTELMSARPTAIPE